jgi:L-fucose isomerase-like protein
MGKKFVFLSGKSDDIENFDFLIKYLKAANAVKSLKNKKIGIIGGKPMMMYQAQVDEISWKAVFGVDFPQFDSTQIFYEMDNNIDEKEAKKIEKEFLSKIDNVTWESSPKEKISQDAILLQAKMFLAFKRFKELNGIDIIANKCHPEMMSCKFGCGYGACLATCMLNDDGILTACEADIPAALSMFILSILGKQSTFFGDIGSIDKDNNTITFFNCGTGPISMADKKQNIELFPIPAFMGDTAVPDEYFMNKVKGACIHFNLEENREVTLLRIGGSRSTIRFHAARLRTIKREQRPESLLDNVWPGYTVEFKKDMDLFLNNTVGHHYVLAYGDYIDELRSISDILGIEFIFDT